MLVGTPQAALPTLERLLQTTEVVSALTRPDRPRGRSGKARPSAVKEAASAAGIEVHEATRGRDLESNWFATVDLAVVVAFGVLIPAAILDLLPFLNVHLSLLPRWRGASPVTAAIAAGDGETGVTIMRIDAGLDTGPIITARTTPIGPEETGGQLTQRLAELGADLLTRTIPPFLAGECEPVVQSEEHASYAPRIEKAATVLSLDDSPDVVARKVRALAPRPGVSLLLEGGGLVRLLSVRPVAQSPGRGELARDGEHILLGLSREGIQLVEVQPAGRAAMSGADWVRGWQSPPIVQQ